MEVTTGGEGGEMVVEAILCLIERAIQELVVVVFELLWKVEKMFKCPESF